MRKRVGPAKCEGWNSWDILHAAAALPGRILTAQPPAGLQRLLGREAVSEEDGVGASE